MNYKYHPEQQMIRVELENHMTLEETEQLLQMLEAVLDQQQRFSLLAVNKENIRGDKQVNKRMSGWLKKNKPLIRKYCAGVAMVINSGKMFKIYQPIAHVMISKMYGCPGKMFVDQQEAVAWLNDQLNGEK